MLLYYITDRQQFPGTDAEQRRSVLKTIEQAARAGVDYIQVRERDLSSRVLEHITRDAVAAVRAANPSTRLLVNSRVDIALAAGADGVHLRSDDPFASEARLMARARSGFIVAVSCHTPADVRSAWSHGADFAVFGPVFEKRSVTPTLVEGLRAACAATPGRVFALGGVTADNASACMKAGAAGIAGIRLFQQTAVDAFVKELRR
ncbi:MAG: thiamine phosphate synthase [Terriglobales bacterium]